MSGAYTIRPAGQTDAAFLGDMIVEAANWRAGALRPRHEVVNSPDHRRYISGWMRPADAGFIACDELDDPIGAAWFRMLPRNDPGFGFVGAAVPELIIGVRPIWRAHGVGRMLLRSLVQEAAGRGYSRISLSVDRDNFARILYRSEGFAVTQSGLMRDTMVRRIG